MASQAPMTEAAYYILLAFTENVKKAFCAEYNRLKQLVSDGAMPEEGEE